MHLLEEACGIWLPETELCFGTPLLFSTSGSAAAHHTSRQSLSRPRTPTQGALLPPQHDFPHCIFLPFRSLGGPALLFPTQSFVPQALPFLLLYLGKQVQELECSEPRAFFSSQGPERPRVLGSFPLSFAQLPSNRSRPGLLVGPGFQPGGDTAHGSLVISEGEQTQWQMTRIKCMGLMS